MTMALGSFEELEPKNAGELLEELSAIYKERNKIYGGTYKDIGYVMMSLMPDGIRLTSAADFNRFICLVQIVGKLSRYKQQFDKGGHKDSLDDLAVYSMMLQELDNDLGMRPSF